MALACAAPPRRQLIDGHGADGSLSLLATRTTDVGTLHLGGRLHPALLSCAIHACLPGTQHSYRTPYTACHRDMPFSERPSLT